MLFFLILGLLLGAVAVVFALQNIMMITVTFLVWQMEGSLALILLLAMLAGVLVSVFVSIPGVIKSHMHHMALRKENKILLDELTLLKKANTSTFVPPTPPNRDVV